MIFEGDMLRNPVEHRSCLQLFLERELGGLERKK